MLDANWVRHCKALGKFAYLYDSASTNVADQTLLMARLYDQIADGTAASVPALELIGPMVTRYKTSIQSGASSQQALAKDMAEAYLKSADFQGDMTNTATIPNNAKSALEALIAEMGDDSKTFTTAGATGFVHFFEEAFAPDGTFPQSGSPTYADGTYCVGTIVA